jgi:hypothetical protein
MSAGSALTYVQLARSLHVDGQVLTLENLAPSTVWLLSGAEEQVGNIATGTFLDLWWEPTSGLSSTLPRAVLALAAAEAQVLGDSVMLLSSPRISGSGIQYDVEVLEGVLPGRSGACVLYIGPVDPKSPDQGTGRRLEPADRP